MLGAGHPGEDDMGGLVLVSDELNFAMDGTKDR